MLLRVERQVFQQRLGRFARAHRRADAVRTGELGHDQPASAQIADEAAEHGIRDARHGRQNRGRGNPYRADRETGGELLHSRLGYFNSNGF